MQHHRPGHNLMYMPVLSVVLVGILAGIAFAKKEPNTYPEEGRVIGTGTTEHTRTNGSIFGTGGTTNGSVSSRSKYTHTYKVQTATKVFELDCGKEAVFHSTGAECLSGGKPIQVGDVIHFRIEKDGTISDAAVERSSGLPFVDRAALRAVLSSSPLPPLPVEYAGSQLGVHLKFE